MEVGLWGVGGFTNGFLVGKCFVGALLMFYA